MTDETTHRGIRWRRDSGGRTEFFDPERDGWVEWYPGVDAPPRPPGWDRRVGRVARPGWRTRWRIIPVVLTVAAVVIAVVQVEKPTGNQVGKEAAASAAMLGRCLARDGTLEGRPKYSAAAVPCGSAEAVVRVVEVLPSTPGSPLCPTGSTGMELPYPGVRYPHIECVAPLRRRG